MRSQVDAEGVRETLFDLPVCEDVEFDVDNRIALVYFADPRGLQDILQALSMAGFPAAAEA